jgi:hypothetical protein
MSFKGMRRSDIIIDLDQAYLEEERYDESIKLLMSIPYFVNWEGSGITWDIFSQSHIRAANKSRNCCRNLQSLSFTKNKNELCFLLA